jgi:hypothetical protein
MSEEKNEFGTKAGNAADDLDSTFQLISRARAGDQDAIERLFARHLTPLQRWASGRLPKWARDPADTDDLVQEALLQTFKKIEDFEPRQGVEDYEEALGRLWPEERKASSHASRSATPTPNWQKRWASHPPKRHARAARRALLRLAEEMNRAGR